MTQKFVLDPKHAERDQVLANAHAFLDRLPASKAWTIEVRSYRKPRTLSQNAALWAVAYPPLLEYMGERGIDAMDRLHEYMCGEFFGWRSPKLGQSVPIRSTTRDEHGHTDEIDTTTMADFYANVQRIGAENGVFIPDPDPMYGLRARW